MKLILLLHQSNKTIKRMYSTFSYLLLLFLNRSMIAAAAPAPVSIIQPASIQPSNALIQSSNSSSNTGGALAFRQIGLNIGYNGVPIPEKEVRDTLLLAEAAITSLVQTVPDERIPNDEFIYSRVESEMLLVITANPEEGFTWLEIARILRVLYQFMTGSQGQAHYNALDFEVQDGSRNVIGNGVVWYLPPINRVQKRATVLGTTIVSSYTAPILDI